MFDFIGYIWNAIEDAAIAALQIAVLVIHWAVIALWAAVTTVANGLVVVGSKLLDGFQKAWDFTKGLYDDVLKPAWDKLHELFTRVRDWLNDTFGPVITALKAIRTYILDFYKDWIRPVLDAIDATRQILKILEALHIAWAQQLDDILGEIEDAVNRALVQVLGRLNKVIGIVDGVVTGNLLFQKVPFLRTLQRDLTPAWKLLTSAPQTALTDYEAARLHRAFHGQTRDEQTADVVGWWNGESSDVGDTLDAHVDTFVGYWQPDANA